MKVYVIEGWFGDIEWIEAIYADPFEAEIVCGELWKERRSNNPAVPDFVQGLCKFAAVEHELLS